MFEFFTLTFNKPLQINTGLFDMARAATYPGWLQSLTSPKISESLEYGIGSVVFRSELPLDSSKLQQALALPPFSKEVIRSKGIVWLDTELGRKVGCIYLVWVLDTFIVGFKNGSEEKCSGVVSS
jgi:G3E family GTPase